MNYFLWSIFRGGNTPERSACRHQVCCVLDKIVIILIQDPSDLCLLWGWLIYGNTSNISITVSSQTKIKMESVWKKNNSMWWSENSLFYFRLKTFLRFFNMIKLCSLFYQLWAILYDSKVLLFKALFTSTFWPSQLLPFYSR